MKSELHITIFHKNVAVASEILDGEKPDFEVLLKYQPIEEMKIGMAYHYTNVGEYRYDPITTMKEFLSKHNVLGETPIERLRNKLTPYYTLTGIALASDIKFKNKEVEKIFKDTVAQCTANMSDVNKWLKFAEETKHYGS